MANKNKRRKISADGNFKDSEAAVELSHDATSTKEIVAKGPRRNTLFVRSLAPSVTTETLAEHFSQSYPLKHATVILNPQTKQSRGYGFVTFVDADNAQQAVAELDGSVLEGRKLRVEIAEPRHREVQENAVGAAVKSVPSAETQRLKAERERQKKEAVQPSPKLIIRNLPWSIQDSDQLAALFRNYGKVKHAELPRKSAKVLAGFGFVVMRGRKNAEKAIDGVNGTEVDGRILAVDWAVDKQIWEELQRQQGEKETVPNAEAEETETQVQEVEEESGIDSNSASSSSPDEDIEIELESEDAEDDIKSTKSKDRDDVTLFIRNVPFTATDESLFDQFARFGPLRYARIVIDPETDRPRGTGFVCFRKPEDAGSCIKQAPQVQPIKKRDHSTALKHSILEQESLDPTGQYSMEGRVLHVSRAVAKDEAARLEEENDSRRKARDMDRRSLFLLSEGTIPKGSPLYEKLSQSEINMREASARQRQNFIKNNPSLHVSLTRLSVRNIPRYVTSKDLKALAREAVVGFATDVKEGRREPLSKEEVHRSNASFKEAEHERKMKGKGIVKQAKVVFEGKGGSKVTENSGAGRSRGYGFIEYVTHRSALMGLRWLNGHAVGGKEGLKNHISKEDAMERKKRLIVEFAIENAVVVNRRREKETKMREYSKRKDSDEVRIVNSDEKDPKRSTTQTKQGKKRKRAKLDTGSENTDKIEQPKLSKNEIRNPTEANRIAKRNRIIAKKRMTRRARNS